MPRTSLRQARSAVASTTQRGAWSDNESVFAAPLAIWLDVTLLNHTGLNQVLERHALPLEVTTYFQLKFQSPKVITVDHACFFVTCAVAPSPRQLFVSHELKLCIAPTLVAGLYDRALRTQPQIGAVLSQPTALPSGGVVWFVWEVLGGVVASYETVAKTILNHVLVRKGAEDLRVWRQRVAALAELIGKQRTFLRNVAHAGRKVGVDERHEESVALDARLERLLHVIGDMRHPAQDMRTRPDLAGQA
jgi:hypothetical protein